MSPSPNPSLRKKTAARLTAVQCLYQRAYVEEGTSPDALIGRVLAMQEEDDPDTRRADPLDKKLLTGIVTGACEQQAALEEKLAAALPVYWKGEKLTPLFKAILRAAAYELIYHPQLKTSILLNEYVGIASSFFDAQETALLNGLMQEVARHVRAESKNA